MSEFAAIYWLGIAFALVPVGLHIAVGGLHHFEHFELKDLYVDLLLFGLAVTVGGFVDGFKLFVFDPNLGRDKGKVIICIGALTIGLVGLAFLYSFSLAGLIPFDWKAWLANVLMVLAFCLTTYFVSVLCAANAHARRS
jgi:hypothetical protein